LAEEEKIGGRRPGGDPEKVKSKEAKSGRWKRIKNPLLNSLRITMWPHSDLYTPTRPHPTFPHFQESSHREKKLEWNLHQKNCFLFYKFQAGNALPGCKII